MKGSTPMSPSRPLRTVVTLTLVGLLGACGGGGDAAGPAPGDGKPVRGGTLTYLEHQPPTCLYLPAAGFYPNGGILNQITDKLTWQNPETLEIEPWIATKWEINEDATEYTFHLRDGVTFSDGTPLDADAVAANFDVYGLGDEKLKLPVAEFVNNYERSEVIDPRTVRFHFGKPSPGFLQGTSVIGAGLVSKKTISLPYEQQCRLKNIVGSGPFTLKKQILDKEVDLVAREDYDWAPPSSEHQGRAYLDEIKIIVTPEDNVRVGALTSGQADMVRYVQAYDEQTVKDAGFLIHAEPTRGVNNGLYLRPGNSLLKDARVRTALRLGTNAKEIVDTLFTGSYPSPPPCSATSPRGTWTCPRSSSTTRPRRTSCSTRRAGRAAPTASAPRTAGGSNWACSSPARSRCRSRPSNSSPSSGRSSASSWRSAPPTPAPRPWTSRTPRRPPFSTAWSAAPTRT